MRRRAFDAGLEKAAVVADNFARVVRDEPGGPMNSSVARSTYAESIAKQIRALKSAYRKKHPVRRA